MTKIILILISAFQIGCATHLIAPPFEGVVIDGQTGVGISDAIVSLQSYDGNVRKVGTTSKLGAVSISSSSKTVWGIPMGDTWYPGKYLVSKEGYLTKEIPFSIGHANIAAKIDLLKIQLEPQIK